MKKWIALLAIACSPAYGAGIGLQIGSSNVNIDDTGASSVNDNDTSFKIFGTFPINNYFSAEAGYIDFGKFDAYYPSVTETDTYKASAIYGAAVFNPEVAKGLRILVKAGIARWSSDVSATALGTISGSGSDSSFDPMIGIGASLDVSPQIALRAEIESYMNVFDGTINYSGTYAGIPVSGSYSVDGAAILVYGLSATYSF